MNKGKAFTRGQKSTTEVPPDGKRKRGQRGPNKSTLAAREAIGRFVDGNAHRLQAWLDEIANGIPYINPETGDQVPGAFIVAPNPEKAAQMFSNIIEYHVPKLQRTEFVGDPDKPLVHQVETVTRRIIKPEPTNE